MSSVERLCLAPFLCLGEIAVVRSFGSESQSSGDEVQALFQYKVEVDFIPGCSLITSAIVLLERITILQCTGSERQIGLCTPYPFAFIKTRTCEWKGKK